MLSKNNIHTRFDDSQIITQQRKTKHSHLFSKHTQHICSWLWHSNIWYVRFVIQSLCNAYSPNIHTHHSRVWIFRNIFNRLLRTKFYSLFFRIISFDREHFIGSWKIQAKQIEIVENTEKMILNEFFFHILI